MKNYDLFVLADQITVNLERLKNLKGAKFNFCLLKNIDLLEKECKILQETVKPSEDFLAYDKARVTLCEEYCAKDENGGLLKKENPQNPGQFEYDIDTKSQEWTNAIDKLKQDNLSILTSRDEQIVQYNELLDAQSDIEFAKVKIDDVPNDITLELMKLIKSFIKE